MPDAIPTRLADESPPTVCTMMIFARSARLQVRVDGAPRLELTADDARRLADDLLVQARRADAIESALGTLADLEKAATQ